MTWKWHVLEWMWFCSLVPGSFWAFKMLSPAVILICDCTVLRSLLVLFAKGLLGAQPDQSRCTIFRVISHKDIASISACISKLERLGTRHCHQDCSPFSKTVCSIACIWQREKADRLTFFCRTLLPQQRITVFKIKTFHRRMSILGVDFFCCCCFWQENFWINHFYFLVWFWKGMNVSFQ